MGNLGVVQRVLARADSVMLQRLLSLVCKTVTNNISYKLKCTLPYSLAFYGEMLQIESSNLPPRKQSREEEGFGRAPQQLVVSNIEKRRSSARFVKKFYVNKPGLSRGFSFRYSDLFYIPEEDY
jgi:hypothetical protein